jgi:multiple sugar transport system permease protein
MTTVTRQRRRTPKLERREARAFLAFVSPWIFGFVVFSAGPLLYSLYLSFTTYNGVQAPQFVGFDNYMALWTDPIYLKSLQVTVTYAAISVPLGIIAALTLAILLNQRIVARGFFRTIFYLPTVMPAVAMALLWQWLFNPDFGLVNYILSALGGPKPSWFLDPNLVLPTFIIMSLWTIGGSVVIFLAALQTVPQELYEAAALDGAGAWRQFRNITVPMISPAILFTTVTGVIGAFQTFTQAYVITGGGPNYASQFLGLTIYQNAFQNFRFGYASAQAWILFAIILSLSLLVIRVSRSKVHYES